MERVVHISKGFEEAEDWDIQQQISMTPQQRLDAAKVLRDRAYPPPHLDLRAWNDQLFRKKDLP